MIRSKNRLKAKILRLSGSNGSLVSSYSARAAGSVGRVAQAPSASTRSANSAAGNGRGWSTERSIIFLEWHAVAGKGGDGGMVDNAAAECNSNLMTAWGAVEMPVCSATF